MGLAVSDSLEIIAKPLKTLDRKKTFDYFSEILNIVIEKNVHKIVVGLPLTLKGKHSDQTKVVQKFIEKLKQAVKIPVIHIDERLSSVAAVRSLKEMGVKTGHEKGRIDETAAAIILQEYLDSKTK
jgi:putative Holliday junction resolvase